MLYYSAEVDVLRPVRHGVEALGLGIRVQGIVIGS